MAKTKPAPWRSVTLRTRALRHLSDLEFTAFCRQLDGVLKPELERRVKLAKRLLTRSRARCRG